MGDRQADRHHAGYSPVLGRLDSRELARQLPRQGRIPRISASAGVSWLDLSSGRSGKDVSGGHPCHIWVMRAWSMSAINSYYLDPVVKFLNAGYRDSGGAAVAISGYYVTPHCDPDCCKAFGGVSKGDLGPFGTAHEARQWSRKNLVENG
jgi:hypothetical protein